MSNLLTDEDVGEKRRRQTKEYDQDVCDGQVYLLDRKVARVSGANFGSMLINSSSKVSSYNEVVGDSTHPGSSEDDGHHQAITDETE